MQLRAGDILVLVNGEYVVIEKVQHELLETRLRYIILMLRITIPIMLLNPVFWCITCAMERNIDRKDNAPKSNRTVGNGVS